MPVEKLRQGKAISGTMVRLASSPVVALMARAAGMDFIMLDMEHGAYSYETLWDMAGPSRAAGLDVFVRVPELSKGTVSRALDCGCAGVMVPMTETPEQARAFAAWAKYPPLGGRGLSSNGPHTGCRRWSSVPAGMADANAMTLAIAQIETALAIRNIDAIAATPGIDVLLIGPNDLALSLGKPGDLNSPEQLAAIRAVAEAARRHGKVFGMHAPADYMEKWIPEGLRFVMNGIDMSLLDSAFQNVQKQNQGLIDRMAKP
jgi:2-keto-3-deoxy-L-rhamnonate aldolase RhmA